MENFSFLWLLSLFFLSALVTWRAGVTLTKTTDTLDTRFRLGDALGGLILLGISGSLPEIAVCLSAARDGHISVIIGNLLGGIAIQTLVIVIFDFAVKKKRPLSYLAGSPILALETLFAISITIIALLATFIPAGENVRNLNPLSVVLAMAWVFGLYMINKARKIKSLNETAIYALPGRRHEDRRKKENHVFYAGRSTVYVISVFIMGCLATLVAGFILEESGTAIAMHIGMSTGIFAATAIALVTSLPEISTGLESILIGDNHLAISDIMGGNAFMLTIFLLADVVSGKPVLSFAGRDDIFLAVLGIIMMAVYGFAFLIKPKKRYLRLGLDSILQIVIYALGVVVLFYIM